jgi:hypothetical protein
MSDLPTVDDAHQQYLAQIARDCERELGPGADLLGLGYRPERGRVRLELTYALAGDEWLTTAEAETLVEAHHALLEAILIDRVRAGFTVLVEP